QCGHGPAGYYLQHCEREWDLVRHESSRGRVLRGRRDQNGGANRYIQAPRLARCSPRSPVDLALGWIAVWSDFADASATPGFGGWSCGPDIVVRTDL